MEPPAFDFIAHRQRYPGELVWSFQRDLLDGFGRLDAAGGDMVAARPGPARLVYVRHPDLIKQVLVDHNDAFTKARGLRLAKHLLGDGLLTSEPPLHERQRRLVLPAFHNHRLRAYAETMAGLTAHETERWADGETIDVGGAMGRLTLAIAGRTLFGADVMSDSDAIRAALATALRTFDQTQFPGTGLLAYVPVPRTVRFRRARATLDELIFRLIRERRAAIAAGAGAGDDLLGMLLAARDEDGSAMSDRQVRDEALTLLIAGHETTANALTWTFALVGAHPQVEGHLHAEIDAVLSGRAVAFDDLPRLAYTRQVFSEALRLYPPAWAVGRRASRDVVIGGATLRAGTVVIFSPYALHRDARFWSEPERFDPERFAPERRPAHKFAFLPFSAGKRGCIGEQFAWTEGVLILATVLGRWSLVAQDPVPAPHGSVTLRPKTPVLMTPRRRAIVE